MIKQTFLASGFGKKTYTKPHTKAYQVKPASILAGSNAPSRTSTPNEEYEEASTSTWF